MLTCRLASNASDRHKTRTEAVEARKIGVAGGMIDAALGRKDNAGREAQQAVGLVPIEKDPLTYAELVKNLAVVYAWTGQNEAALNELKSLLQIPAPFSYGELRLHPYWDPLRDDPRFEKLVEEAKQPIAIK